MRKTKLFTILVLMAMIVLSFASVVSAATTEMTVTASKTVVKTGDEVTVTIHSSQATEGANFVIEYNHSFLEYKSSNAMARNLEEGRFEFVNADGMNDFTVTFKVIGKEGSDTVKVTPVQITNGTNDNFEVTKKSDSVKIEIKKDTTTTPTTPTTPSKPSTPKPDKMPQTGFNVAPVIGIVALVAVVASVIAVKKRK